MIPKCIGGVSDHVHLLLTLPTKLAVARNTAHISTRDTSGISRARSYRTLRDGSLEGRLPRHFVPGYDRCRPSVTRWRTFRHFARAVPPRQKPFADRRASHQRIKLILFPKKPSSPEARISYQPASTRGQGHCGSAKRA